MSLVIKRQSPCQGGQGRVALIDGDIITYSCGFAAEGEPIQYVLNTVKKLIDSICEATDSDGYKTFLTGSGNYREKVATLKPYKGNRKGKKPQFFDDIREYILHYKCGILIEGREADDAMGCEQTLNTVICSLDKDLDQIPGEHYNWRKGYRYTITEWQGLRFFYKQLLTGDTVDNIGGCYGIGPKKAEKLLKGCKTEKELYQTCLMCYANEGNKDYQERLTENAHLLWIQRKAGVLWTPPN